MPLRETSSSPDVATNILSAAVTNGGVGNQHQDAYRCGVVESSQTCSLMEGLAMSPLPHVHGQLLRLRAPLLILLVGHAYSATGVYTVTPTMTDGDEASKDSHRTEATRGSA